MELPALLTALGRFADATKAGIGNLSDLTDENLDALTVEMTKGFEGQTAAMGAPFGATFQYGVGDRLVEPQGVDLDVGLANHFTKRLTGPVAFKPIKAHGNGRVTSFSLRIINPNNYAVTFWPGISWNKGQKPTLTTNGQDILSFVSRDGGVTWDGFVVGLNVKLPA